MGITLTPKVVESCSNPQKTRQVFKSAMKKKNLVLFFFVNDVISGVLLGLLGPLHLALGPNCYMAVFRSLETRLKPESFDTLDDLLALRFRVEKL